MGLWPSFARLFVCCLHPECGNPQRETEGEKHTDMSDGGTMRASQDRPHTFSRWHTPGIAYVRAHAHTYTPKAIFDHKCECYQHSVRQPDCKHIFHLTIITSYHFHWCFQCDTLSGCQKSFFTTGVSQHSDTADKG